MAEENAEPYYESQDDVAPVGPPHVYTGERCIHCGVNLYDAMLYGPDGCIEYDGRKTVWTFEAGRNDMEDVEFENDLRSAL